MTIKALNKNINTIIKLILIFLLLLNFSYWTQYFSFKSKGGLMEVTMLDIGQGDSILIKTPNNFYGLIDAGKVNFILDELSEQMPFNYKKLDFVIMTHPDADHVEGYIEILKRYQVDKVFIQKNLKENELLAEIEKILKEKNIDNYALSELTDFSIDEVEFDVTWPKSINSIYEIEDSNELSTAIKISYKNFDMFSAGDLGGEFELESIEQINSKDIDVLKVGHHGSKSSSSIEALELLQPEISLISVGLNNSYGHPAGEIIENLNKVNSEIFRTDIDGRVNLATNGYNIKIGTQNGKYKEILLK